MLLGDIIPSRAYLASTVIAIGGVGMPSSRRRIISTSLLSREILHLSSPLYNGFGGRDDAHNSMPLNDKIAMQKRKAYAALSLFHKTLSSLPNASSSLSMLSSRMWSIFHGLEDEYNKSLSLSLSRRAEYWSCIDGAMSYAVPMDPAAGIGIGRPSRPYCCMLYGERDGGHRCQRQRRRGEGVVG